MGKPRNIILLVVDSLRYDSIFNQDPQLPYTLANSTKYNWARSSACWTLPATTCLFTGKMPHEHGATSQSRGFKDEIPTLAEQLKGVGYNTYQATANIVTTDIFGLDRGFDEIHRTWNHVESRFPFLMHLVVMAGKPRIRKMLLSKDFMFQKMATDLKVGVSWTQATHQETFDFVRKKMAENEAKGESSFFFMNLMEAHFPYHVGDTFKLSAPGLGGKWKEAWGLFHTLNMTFMKKDKYPVSAETEEVIRKRQYAGWNLVANPIDEFIKEMHQDKNNLVILCADHADNFGDQEWHYHFSNVTDGGNHIPLMWLDPQQKGGKEANHPVSSRFIHDDILKAAGIEHNGGTLREETASNMPILQSYWHNNNGETLNEYRFNQLCFIQDDQRFVYRDDVDRKFGWLKAPVGQHGAGLDEPKFEPVEMGFDPVEEAVTDTERKNYLRQRVAEFKEFSNKITKDAKV